MVVEWAHIMPSKRQPFHFWIQSFFYKSQLHKRTHQPVTAAPSEQTRRSHSSDGSLLRLLTRGDSYLWKGLELWNWHPKLSENPTTVVSTPPEEVKPSCSLCLSSFFLSLCINLLIFIYIPMRISCYRFTCSRFYSDILLKCQLLRKKLCFQK